MIDDSLRFAYQIGSPQESNLIFGGASVLGGAVDGLISVRDMRKN